MKAEVYPQFVTFYSLAHLDSEDPTDCDRADRPSFGESCLLPGKREGFNGADEGAAK